MSVMHGNRRLYNTLKPCSKLSLKRNALFFEITAAVPESFVLFCTRLSRRQLMYIGMYVDYTIINSTSDHKVESTGNCVNIYTVNVQHYAELLSAA